MAKAITIAGTEFPNIKAACNAYSINQQTVYKRMREKGWELERAITTPNVVKHLVKDPTGRWFDSFNDMCKAWKQAPHRVEHRMRQTGWTLEQALMTPKGGNKDKCTLTQPNYKNVLAGLNRLKRQVTALEKSVSKCIGADIRSTHRLESEIESAGISVSNACGYASFLEERINKKIGNGIKKKRT